MYPLSLPIRQRLVEYRILRVTSSLLLIGEAIQGNTNDALRHAVIMVFNAFKSSKAQMQGKIPLMVTAAQRMVTNYDIGSKTSNDKKKSLDNAARIVGVILFLLQLEDLHQIIDSTVHDLTQTRQDYMDRLQKEYPDKQPLEPTIQQFLQNKYIPYRTNILKMLTYKTKDSKDPQTTIFRQNTKDVEKAEYQLLSSDEIKGIVATQLLKLTLDQLTDLSRKIQSALPRILAVKRAIGQASRAELNTELFHLTPAGEEEKNPTKEVPDQKPINVKMAP